MNLKKILVFKFILLVFPAVICFAQIPTRTITESNLRDEVVVRRDGRSIPYIEAKNEADLYFAQGFVTASDRLWQMDLYRRVASGRTAELFGKLTLEEDKRWRRFGFSEIVQKSYQNYPPAYRKILDDYARGVNAYIATLDKKTLPPEFQILQYAPEEWKPTDSLIIGAILADGLSTTWQFDLLKSKFANLPKDVYQKLFLEKTPFDVLVVGKDFERSKVIKAGASNSNIKIDESLFQLAKTDAETRKSSLERIGLYDEFNAASNNWVISGKRTLDGKAILANDPHLPLSVPNIWYLTNLLSPNGKVSGVTFPGVPGIVLGHNEFIAWGATNLGPDVQDLYVETVNDKNEYKTANGWKPLKKRVEQIRVKQNPLKSETETVELEVSETENGVVILEQNDKKYALKWTALDPKNDTFEAFYKLNYAKNWDDFKTALSRYGGATQNFVYADVKGNIGFHNAGAIPIRNSGGSDLPFDGSKNIGQWTGQIPFAELPESFNPPEGFIVTANQRLAGDSYKYFLGTVWADPYRARRIVELLKANNKQTINDSEDIQRDIYSISFANFAREIIKMEGASPQTLEILKGWDGKMSADSNAALIISEIRIAFLRKILNAKIGADLAKDYRSSTINSTIDRLAREQPAGWLPKEFKNYKELFMASEVTALENLTRKYEADKANWTWGNERKINFVHPLSNAPLIGGVFKIAPISGYGSGLTPNVGSSVSMRHITVAGDWDKTRHGISAGQSGDPKSPFYKDQIQSWSIGRTPEFPFSNQAIEQATKEIVVMNPNEK
ncbi:MAG: penicillin acylase family protein [Pyrinomonadaceae bacterium]